MKEIIIYSGSCLNCTHKKQLRELLNLAQAFGFKVTIKRTALSRELAEEAKQVSKLQPPFIYDPESSKSVPFNHGIDSLL
jgi:hypothetical protein